MYWFSDIFVSLLHPRYRRRFQNSPIAGTFRSGILQTATALIVYGALFFRYLSSQYGAQSANAMDHSHGGGVNLYWLSFGMGAVGWLSFSISPAPLAAMYFMIEGVVRALSGGIFNEPMPSLPFWIIGAMHGAFEREKARRQLPPPALDVVEVGQPGDGWDLRVTSARPKDGWHALVQIDYKGTYYLIRDSGAEQVEGAPRHRYYLRKARGTEGFRGIIRYDPFAEQSKV